MMRRLQETDFPQVWDAGAERHDLDRALVMLHHALPEWSYAELARLSIGRRDGLLLELRRRSFGAEVKFSVVCPHCNEILQDGASIDELLLRDPWAEQPERHQTRVGDVLLEFRLMDTHDLAAVATLGDEAATRELARRCLLRAQRGELELEFDALSDAELGALAEAMDRADPQASLEFAMVCPACTYEWMVLYDVVVFLWKEIVTRAKLLLRDVHDLACRYGWSEAEVLSLAPARRSYYLEEFDE